MLHLLLTAALAPVPTIQPVLTPSGPTRLSDEVYERRLEEAGKDPGLLWDLVIWCEDTDREKEAQSVLRRIVRIEPDHLRARQKLGHISYDGEWFTTEKKLAAYKAKEEERLAKERGYVRYKKTWVHPDDLPFLERGLVRGPDDQWWTEEDLDHHEKGWLRQDLVWVSPDEAGKMEEGLWKCGDQWLSQAEADRYHSKLETAWLIPSDHLVLRTTCSRETAMEAIGHMERGFPDLVRLFGRAPSAPVEVFLAGSGGELGTLCAGGQQGVPPIETRGLIESLEAVFAESWYQPEPETWLGAGASWWDPKEDNGDKFGVHRARFALGLSVVDALDPSPKAVEKLLKKKGPYEGFAASYYKEKQLPPWLRWGAAVYVSRYYPDQVGRGGDPFWTRKWSVGNLERRGGFPGALRTVFDMELTGREQDNQMSLAAGLLVAFILDGECAPVRGAHAELKAALRQGEAPGKALSKLRKELEAHEEDLRAFAGS